MGERKREMELDPQSETEMRSASSSMLIPLSQIKDKDEVGWNEQIKSRVVILKKRIR